MIMSKRAQGIPLVASLVLIVTFVFLANLSPVSAQDIAPDQFITIGPVSFVPLLVGQSATISLTSSAAFGFQTIGIASYGNSTLSVNISGMTNTAFGFWTLTIIGTGGRNWFDYATGFYPFTGSNAQIDVNDALSFAIATGTVFITNPGDGGYPVNYKLKVGP